MKSSMSTLFHRFAFVLCSLLFIFPINSNAKPNTNQLKYWLGDQKVVIKKVKLLPDKSEVLSNGSIQKLKVVNDKTGFNKLYSITTLTLEFDYLPEKGESAIQCSGTVTYSWLTAAGPMGKNELQSASAKCL